LTREVKFIDILATSVRNVYLFPIFSTTVWGVSIVGAKILSEIGLKAIEIVYFRFLIASLFFVPVLLFSKGKVLPKRREWLYIIGLAITGVSVNNLVFYLGLERTDASIAAMIVSINPLMTMIFAVLILREHMSRLKWLSVLLGIAGVSLLVGWNVSFGRLIGNLLILLAASIWGLSFSFSKMLSNQGFSPVIVTAWSVVIGTLFLSPFNLHSFSKFLTLNPVFWGWILFIAIVASVISYILHYKAIEVLGAGTVAPSTNIIPFSGAVTAALLLGERITLLAVIGFILVLLGVILVQVEARNSSAGASPAVLLVD